MDPRLQQQTPILDASNSSEGELAIQACQSCRKQKRRCDKRLPSCSLCQRIGRTCDYNLECPQNGAAPSHEDFAALRQQVADLQDLVKSVMLQLSNSADGYSRNTDHRQENQIDSISTRFDVYAASSSRTFSQSAADERRQLSSDTGQLCSEFPVAFCLDSEIYQYSRLSFKQPRIKVPPGALYALGGSEGLRLMIDIYFETVHSYFPIVSRIRLGQHLVDPKHEPGADAALLFLSMKLVSSDVPDKPESQTQLYHDIKSFYSYIEAQNGLTVQSLQALLLICLYEIGHGLYPAAFISTGHAARIAYTLGVHDSKSPQLMPRPHTWTEIEERQRVWWAVLLLDRFVHIGSRGKPFATSDPSLDIFLPTDDAAWDRGQMLAATPLALSASNTTPVAPFARTCQAAHLLGKVLRHLDDRSVGPTYRCDEALQLHHTLVALADVASAELEAASVATRPALCTSVSLCYSGLAILYDGYSCSANERNSASHLAESPPETRLAMQSISIEGVSDTSEHVTKLARHVRRLIDDGQMHRLNPLVIDCIYQAAANYGWYLGETSNPQARERLDEMKNLLSILDSRWRVAGAYLSLLADFWDNPVWTPQKKDEIVLGLL